MTKRKDSDETTEVQAFPDGYQINAWHNDGRETEIAASRTRLDEKRPAPHGSYKKYKGKLWFPLHEIPEGWQYAWMTERLLNEPQHDNLQDAYQNGWDFVKQSEHPNYMVRELYSNPDDHIRRYNNVLMKKLLSDYKEDQREHINESIKKQKEVSYLTDYFGAAPNDPIRGVYENSGNYTPAFRER